MKKLIIFTLFFWVGFTYFLHAEILQRGNYDVVSDTLEVSDVYNLSDVTITSDYGSFTVKTGGETVLDANNGGVWYKPQYYVVTENAKISDDLLQGNIIITNFGASGAITCSLEVDGDDLYGKFWAADSDSFIIAVNDTLDSLSYSGTHISNLNINHGGIIDVVSESVLQGTVDTTWVHIIPSDTSMVNGYNQSW